jgi:hypothetical protein
MLIIYGEPHSKVVVSVSVAVLPRESCTVTVNRTFKVFGPPGHVPGIQSLLLISKAPVILDPDTLQDDEITKNSGPVAPVNANECDTTEYGATPPVIGPEYDPFTTLLKRVISQP